MAEDMTEIQRLLGKLTAQYESLAQQLTRVEVLINKISDKHDRLIQRVVILELDKARVQGGWKATVIISGTVVAIWSMLSIIIEKMWPFLTKGH